MGRAHLLTPLKLNCLIGLLRFLSWIVALVDGIKGNRPNTRLWVVRIVLLPFLGTILSFTFDRGPTRA